MTNNVYTKFIDKNNNPLALAYCLSVTTQINLSPYPTQFIICLEHLLYTSDKLHILEVSEVSKLIYVKYGAYVHFLPQTCICIDHKICTSVLF